MGEQRTPRHSVQRMGAASDDVPALRAEEPGSKFDRRIWTDEEDRQIAALVEVHGSKAWATIAAKLPTRNSKQCRERWHNHLDPEINKSNWTLEEDERLIEAHKLKGNHWAEIAVMLPGRTDNQIKNRWNSALRRELRKFNRLATKQSTLIRSVMTKATAALSAAAGASEADEKEAEKEDSDSQSTHSSQCALSDVNAPEHPVLNASAGLRKPPPQLNQKGDKKRQASCEGLASAAAMAEEVRLEPD